MSTAITDQRCGASCLRDITADFTITTSKVICLKRAPVILLTDYGSIGRGTTLTEVNVDGIVCFRSGLCNYSPRLCLKKTTGWTNVKGDAKALGSQECTIEGLRIITSLSLLVSLTDAGSAECEQLQ